MGGKHSVVPNLQTVAAAAVHHIVAIDSGVAGVRPQIGSAGDSSVNIFILFNRPICAVFFHPSFSTLMNDVKEAIIVSST